MAFTYLAGPSLLLLTMVLLFAKTAFLLGRPVWIFGMCFSTSISVFISYLSAKEFFASEKRQQDEAESKGKEAGAMRSVLEETHALYKRKIAQLEESILEVEQEVKNRDAEIDEMKVGYEKLYDETASAKNQASSFHSSLEDALDELRELRQIYYLEKEGQKHVPQDLVQQHRQLREQFEEKTLVLEQTRRRLHVIEGQLIALKKERGFEMLDERAEEHDLIDQLETLSRENAHLEKEVAHLEEMISDSMAPKKKAPAKAKKKVEQMLELQFDHIDSET